MSKLSTLATVWTVLCATCLGASSALAETTESSTELADVAIAPPGNIEVGSGRVPTAGAETVYSLIADTQLQSLALQNPLGSFAGGVQYAGVHLQVDAMIRTTPGSISGNPGGAEFGTVVLSPQSQAFGASLEAAYYLYSGRYCTVVEDGGCGANPTYYQKWQYGPHAGIDFGSSTAKVTSGAEDAVIGDEQSFKITTVRAYLGGITRAFTFDLAVPLGIILSLDGTLRFASGDITKQQRELIFGRRDGVYGGADLSIKARIGNATVGVALSLVGPYGVHGLSKFQASPAISFSLPLSVAAAGTSSSSSGPGASGTPRQEQAQANE